MHIVKAKTNSVSQFQIAVCNDSDGSAVQKVVDILFEKEALYPLHPTFYSSGREGFVLDGFAIDELESIGNAVLERVKARTTRGACP